MPVTTRRRAAALSAVRPSSLKKPTPTTTNTSPSSTKITKITKPTPKPTTTRPPLRRNKINPPNNNLTTKPPLPLHPQPQSAPPTTTHHPTLQSPSYPPYSSSSTFPPPIHRRRLASLPHSEPLSSVSPPSISCRYGHRLYSNRAKWQGSEIVSPKNLVGGSDGGGLKGQARFYERELERIGGELAATGEGELWRVHGVVDLAVGMLRGFIGKDEGGEVK